MLYFCIACGEKHEVAEGINPWTAGEIFSEAPKRSEMVIGV